MSFTVKFLFFLILGVSTSFLPIYSNDEQKSETITLKDALLDKGYKERLIKKQIVDIEDKLTNLDLNKSSKISNKTINKTYISSRSLNDPSPGFLNSAVHGLFSNTKGGGTTNRNLLAQNVDSATEAQSEPVSDVTDLKNSVKELLGRIEALEEAQINEATSENKVYSYNSQRLYLGGYVEGVLNGFLGHTTEPQVSFKRATIAFNIAGDVNERLRVFTQLLLGLKTKFNDKNAADRLNLGTTFDNDFQLIYGQYKFKDWLTMRFGRFITPFGIINQEFLSPLFLKLDRPLPLRNVFFENSINGLEFSGILPMANRRFGYNLYTFSPFKNTKDLGGGGRLFWTSPNEFVTFGLSNNTSERGGSRTIITNGADLKLQWKRLIVRNEFLHSVVERGREQWGWYVQPALKFFNDKLIAFASVDYLNDGFGVNSVVDPFENPFLLDIADPINKYEYTVGINYIQWTYLRNRIELTWHNYTGSYASSLSRNPDYFSLEYSSTISY